MADDAVLAPGEQLAEAPEPVRASIGELIAEERRSRLELAAAETQFAALRAHARVSREARLPTVSSFADGIYANPNPRYLPPASVWIATWDVGVSATWSPNDVAPGRQAGRDVGARRCSRGASRRTARRGR